MRIAKILFIKIIFFINAKFTFKEKNDSQNINNEKSKLKKKKH